MLKAKAPTARRANRLFKRFRRGSAPPAAPSPRPAAAGRPPEPAQTTGSGRSPAASPPKWRTPWARHYRRLRRRGLRPLSPPTSPRKSTPHPVSRMGALHFCSFPVGIINLFQKVRVIGHNAVRPYSDEIPHLLRVVDGPVVYRQVVAVHPLYKGLGRQV